MRIDVFTIFPDIVEQFCAASLLGKARVALDWLLNLVFGSDPVQLKVDYPGASGGMGPSGTRRPPTRTVDPRG